MPYYCGIDVGSVFLKYAYFDSNLQLIKSTYIQHFDSIQKCIDDTIDKDVSHVAITASKPQLIEHLFGIPVLNSIKCISTAVHHAYPNIFHIVDIGANSSCLINFSDDKKFVSSVSNSLCSAGTGSFLDQQAQRLGLKTEQFSSLECIENPPSIASRCSVFAKSDLIHCQQEGYTIGQMWAGLCKGMLQTCFNTLLKGKQLKGNTVIVGGVGLNPQIQYYLKNNYSQCMVSETPHLMAAKGAVLTAKKNDSFIPLNTLLKKRHISFQKEETKQKKLILRKSKYPSFDVFETKKDSFQNEIRVITPLKKQKNAHHLYIGIDIGSTSTKAVVMTHSHEIVLDVYRKTAGEPIEATKNVLRAIQKSLTEMEVVYSISGIGTTGSGRNMVGKIIGADLIVNEITAHANAAAYIDPSVETVFEIGGQDSKYMQIRQGNVASSNMNYVCAAGTGSFIEEQAQKLDVAIENVGDMVLGMEPPITSDRCTVFMEQDIDLFLKKGYSPQEVLAATMYSVVRNYLRKVVGNRKISDFKILFQGATARNKGLVAAFEQVLDREIVVSPFCHIMGAYGVSLLMEKELGDEHISTFKGFSVIDETISITSDECLLCANKCTISHAHYGSDRSSVVSWGYLCGRDPEDSRRKIYTTNELLNKKRKIDNSYVNKNHNHSKTIGIPMVLSNHSLFPLWQEFFNSLGYNVTFTNETSRRIIDKSNKYCGSELCMPAKLGIGHTLTLLDNETVDFIFLPSILEQKQQDSSNRSWFCPLAFSQPYYTYAALRDHKKSKNIMYSTISMNWTYKKIISELHKGLFSCLAISKKKVAIAWGNAVTSQERYILECQKVGEKSLSRILQSHKNAVVLIGRPYTIYDRGINLDLSEKIAQHDLPIVPIEFIPFNEKTKEELRDGYHDMFWHYGQIILNALEFVRKQKNLFAVYVSNFNCGPDSFLLSFAERTMGIKPMLILELDEHNSSGGYQTRIDAFVDIISRNPTRTSLKYKQDLEIVSLSDVDKKKKIIIPLCGSTMKFPIVTAAIFERLGYTCEFLGESTDSNYDLARKYARGSECCPAIAILGVIAEKIKNSEENEFYIAMKTGIGPCRQGQYVRFLNDNLHQIRDNITIRFINITRSFGIKDSINANTKMDIFKGIVTFDILKKLVFRTRPYEVKKGTADLLYTCFEQKIIDSLRTGEPLEPLVKEMNTRFSSVPLHNGQQRTLVGIVGEIYVRHDSYINEQLIHEIETHGGEVWLRPLSDWFIEATQRDVIDLKNSTPKKLTKITKRKLSVLTMEHIERRMVKLAGPLLNNRYEPKIHEVYREGSRYMSPYMRQEDLTSIGRTVIFARDDNASMVVNVKPFSCMPGNVAESILQRVQEDCAMPIVSISYEGGRNSNEPVRTMLQNL